MRILVCNNEYTDLKGLIYATGFMFYEGKAYKGAALTNLLSQLDDEQGLRKIIDACTGKFMIICELGGRVYVVNDLARSFPLLYRKAEGEWVISDDYRPLIQRGDELDPIAALELRSSLQVTGKYTLINGIYQTDAASYLSFSDDVEPRKVIYAHHATPTQGEETQVLDKMKKAYNEAFDRMIEYLDGRQAVIPLSGGSDSRSILAALSARGYKDIYTFSYGLDVRDEAAISKSLADMYAVPWKLVPYIPSDMGKLYYSSEFDKVSEHVGSLYAAPCIQDWYAVYYLKKNGLIKENAVFLPGHAVPSEEEELTAIELSPNSTYSTREIAQKFVNRFYLDAPITTNKEEVIERLAETLNDNGERLDYYSAYTALRDIYHHERQSKFLVNAARVYETMGFDWYAPHMDRDIYEVWNIVPKSMGDGRKIYYTLIEALFPGIYDKHPSYGHEGEQDVKKEEHATVKTKLKKALPGLYKFYCLLLVRSKKNNCNLYGYMDLMDIATSYARNISMPMGIVASRKVRQIEQAVRHIG